jgi:hypothetical protein
MNVPTFGMSNDLSLGDDWNFLNHYMTITTMTQSKGFCRENELSNLI